MTQPPDRSRSPHMSEEEIVSTLGALRQDPPNAQDLRARLAWRPAWSIRSRRGALAAFVSMFRRS